MKKTLIYSALSLFFLILTATWAQSGEMSIQVRSGQLRSEPAYLSQVTGNVSYADRVTVIESRSPWVRVRHNNRTGWIHESALTRQRLALSAGGQRAGGAGDDEIALAGRGFNAEVESEFRRDHADLNFAEIDRMERMAIPLARINQFLATGQLTPAE